MTISMRQEKSETLEDAKTTEAKKEQVYSTVPIDCRCPKKLSCLPTKPCSWALNAIYEQGSPDEQCEWFVVHADSNYCFFAYQYFNSRAHTLEEIATLINSTIQPTDIVASRAIDKLRRLIKKKRPDMIDYVRDED